MGLKAFLKKKFLKRRTTIDCKNKGGVTINAAYYL